MNALFAFIKKEWLEQLRTGKLLILGALFTLFGIMNPAVAKLTPWLFEVLSDSLAETGLTVGTVTITALDSWVQFFKNIPMALIAFVLIESAVFTREYESGTLVLSLSKGLSRWNVVLAKTVVVSILWTALYWLCFAITYGYNAYFWDNSIAQNLGISVFFWWLFGMWVIGLLILFSVLLRSNSGVLVGTGSASAISYLAGFLPKIGDYLPTALTKGTELIYGLSKPEDYLPSLMITVFLLILGITASLPLFNRKQI